MNWLSDLISWWMHISMFSISVLQQKFQVMASPLCAFLPEFNVIYELYSNRGKLLQSKHPASSQNGSVDPAVFVQGFVLFIWLMYPLRPHAAAQSASDNTNLWCIVLFIHKNADLLLRCPFVPFFPVYNVFIAPIWLNDNNNQDNNGTILIHAKLY